MGLLDDAIREHLELRRRMGADASEVARMEQEALGPVVRGEPFTTPEEAPLAEDAEPHAFDDENEQQLDIHDALEDPSPHEDFGREQDPEELAYEDAAAGGPASEYLQTPVHEHDAFQAQDEVAPLAGAEQEQELLPYTPPAGAGQETAEYDVEAVHEADGAIGPPPAELAPDPATAVHQTVEADGVHLPQAPPQIELPGALDHASDAEHSSADDAEPTDEAEPAHQAEPAHGTEVAHEARPTHEDETQTESADAPAPAHEPPPVPENEETLPGAATGGPDVLEQTPEFLQETPEHDRLWFEQAPPKDFDFDK